MSLLGERKSIDTMLTCPSRSMDSDSESSWSLVDGNSIRKMDAKLADKDGHWLITPREGSIDDDIVSEYNLGYEEEASDDGLVSEGEDLSSQNDICVSGELSEKELLPCLTTSTIATDINNLLDAKDALIASYSSQTQKLLGDLRQCRYRLKRALEQLERMRRQSQPLNPKAKVFVPGRLWAN